MGMDIYGKNPTLVGTKPELDFSIASDEAKKEFFEQLNEWEDTNPGYYFRANIWSWRPIQIIIEFVNQKNDLGLNTDVFGENGGKVLETQELESLKEIKKSHFQQSKILFAFLVFVAFFNAILYALVPSQKDALLILAGGKTIEYIKADKSLQKIPFKTTELVAGILDKELNKLKQLTPKEGAVNDSY
jgi:hypothetical protein